MRFVLIFFDFQIHKILSNTPAVKDGRLKKGDRILAVNGMSMRGLTHRESICVLKVWCWVNHVVLFGPHIRLLFVIMILLVST